MLGAWTQFSSPILFPKGSGAGCGGRGLGGAEISNHLIMWLVPTSSHPEALQCPHPLRVTSDTLTGIKGEKRLLRKNKSHSIPREIPRSWHTANIELLLYCINHDLFDYDLTEQRILWKSPWHWVLRCHHSEKGTAHECRGLKAGEMKCPGRAWRSTGSQASSQRELSSFTLTSVSQRKWPFLLHR